MVSATNLYPSSSHLPPPAPQAPVKSPRASTRALRSKAAEPDAAPAARRTRPRAAARASTGSGRSTRRGRSRQTPRGARANGRAPRRAPLGASGCSTTSPRAPSSARPVCCCGPRRRVAATPRPRRRSRARVIRGLNKNADDAVTLSEYPRCGRGAAAATANTKELARLRAGCRNAGPTTREIASQKSISASHAAEPPPRYHANAQWKSGRTSSVRTFSATASPFFACAMRYLCPTHVAADRPRRSPATCPRTTHTTHIAASPRPVHGGCTSWPRRRRDLPTDDARRGVAATCPPASPRSTKDESRTPGPVRADNKSEDGRRVDKKEGLVERLELEVDSNNRHRDGARGVRQPRRCLRRGPVSTEYPRRGSLPKPTLSVELSSQAHMPSPARHPLGLSTRHPRRRRD